MSKKADAPMSMRARCVAWGAKYGPAQDTCRSLYERGCPFDAGDEAVLAWMGTKPTGLTKAIASKMRGEILKRTGPEPTPEPVEGADTSGNSYADTVADQGRLVRFLTTHLKHEMDAGMLPSQEIFDMRDKAIHRQRELARDEQKIREAGENMVPKQEAVDAVQRVVSLYDDSWDQVGFKLLDRMRGKKMEAVPEVFEELRLEVAARINNELSSWIA